MSDVSVDPAPWRQVFLAVAMGVARGLPAPRSVDHAESSLGYMRVDVELASDADLDLWAAEFPPERRSLDHKGRRMCRGPFPLVGWILVMGSDETPRTADVGPEDPAAMSVLARALRGDK